MNKPIPGRAIVADQGGREAAYLIAGMHRSGTSALARVFALLGAELPRTLAGIREDNPKGFWEPALAASLNDSLLAELGVAWDDVLGILIRRQELAARTDVIARIEEVLASEYSLQRPLVLKEPRMALLLDPWISAVRARGLAPKVVIPFRNPLEVAASLAQRDGFSTGRSLLLWLAYFLAAERSSRGAPRVFTQYSDLLADWRGVIRRTETAFGQRFAGWSPAAEIEVDRFISSGDRHQVATPELVQVRADVVSWVKDAYAWACEAAHNPAIGADRLDTVADQFGASLGVFAPLIAEQRDAIATEHKLFSKAQQEKGAAIEASHQLAQEQAATAAKLGDMAAAAVAQQNRIVELGGEIRAHQQRAAELEDQLSQRATQMTSLQQQIQDRQGDLLRVATEIQAKETRIGALEQEVVRLQDAVAARDGRLNAIAADLEQQISRSSAERETLAGTIAERDARVAMLEGELDAAKQHIAKLTDDLASLNASLASRQVEAEQLRAQLGQSSAALAEAERQIALMSENAEAFSRQSRAEHEAMLGREADALRRLDEQAAHLTEMMRALEAVKQEGALLESRLLKVRGELHVRVDEIARLAADSRSLDELERQLGAALQERDCSREEVARIQVEREQLENERDAALLAARSARSEITSLVKEVATVEQERNVLAQRNQVVQVELSGFKSELMAARAERERLDAAVSAAQGERDTLQSELRKAIQGQERSRNEADAQRQAAAAVRARAREIAEQLDAQRRTARQARDAAEAAIGRERWTQWERLPRPRKRFAALFRHGALRPLLNLHWGGRAAALLSSPLYARLDGPGGRAIVSYASKAPNAPPPHPLFDDKWYARSGPVRGVPALDFLWRGDKNGRDPHPLFNTARYRSLYRDVLVHWRLSALEHFIQFGAALGFSPHALFDTRHYVPQAPEVFERGINPLVHYLRDGWRQGLDPHPLFNTDYYYETYPDIRTAGVPALLHYVTTGYLEGRNPHPLFETSYYLRENPDVAAAGHNPLAHYVEQGWRDGRKPNPDFDPRAYLRLNADAAAADAEPLAHYARTAWRDQLERAELPAEPAIPSSESVPKLKSVPADSNSFELFAAPSRERGDNYDWDAHERLAEHIRTDERKRIEQLRPVAPNLIKLAESELADAVRRLHFDRHEAPDVSIIVPVYNQAKYTIECLTSVAATASEARFEVIVIDDASQDATRELVSGIEGVRYLRNERNAGYLRTVNRAAKAATADTLIILNNDTQVQKGWLRPLLDALTDTRVGIAAPMLLFANGRLQEAGGKLCADGGSSMIGLFDDPELPRYAYDREVDYVSGACIALRRKDFDELGGFDERYAPAYCEDSDLCMRIRAAGMRVQYVAKSRVVHHLSVTSDALPGSYKHRQARVNQQKLLERWSEALAALDQVRVVSFYLPQFHTIPENDRWWGAGFTEWRNVAKALPNYAGHYQPHRPAELGYYDLSNPEVMVKQAALAQEYGVDGFCFYYYWFGGRRVLEKPLERILQTGEPDFPFCICWANENWTRTWDGQEKDVLLAQSYSPEDDEAIIADVMRYMRLSNYIRISGRPLFVVYRPQNFPNPKATTDRWRRACRAAGIGEIYLAMVEVFEHALTYRDPRTLGFDASIEFPPSGMSVPINPGKVLNPSYTGTVCSYQEVVRRYLKEPIPAYTRFRGAMPSWDNTARRQDNSYVFEGATPGAFQAWLEAIIEQTRMQNFGDERIVFINAWNEWAEGAHLEPDIRFGRGWLEAVRNARSAQRLLMRKGG